MKKFTIVVVLVLLFAVNTVVAEEEETASFFVPAVLGLVPSPAEIAPFAQLAKEYWLSHPEVTFEVWGFASRGNEAWVGDSNLGNDRALAGCKALEDLGVPVWHHSVSFGDARVRGILFLPVTLGGNTTTMVEGDNRTTEDLGFRDMPDGGWQAFVISTGKIKYTYHPQPPPPPPPPPPPAKNVDLGFGPAASAYVNQGESFWMVGAEAHLRVQRLQLAGGVFYGKKGSADMSDLLWEVRAGYEVYQKDLGNWQLAFQPQLGFSYLSVDLDGLDLGGAVYSGGLVACGAQLRWRPSDKIALTAALTPGFAYGELRGEINHELSKTWVWFANGQFQVGVEF